MPSTCGYVASFKIKSENKPPESHETGLGMDREELLRRYSFRLML